MLESFNSNSPDQVSKLFFGGDIVVDDIIQELDADGNPKRFLTGKKKGELKTKKQKVKKRLNGLGLKPHKNWTNKKEGVFQTNDTVLKIISLRKETDAGKVAKTMLDIRFITKQMSTYFDAVKKYIHEDGCVHAELSHCGYDKGHETSGGGTNTGRLSSRNPNVQNQPRNGTSLAKQHFISRFPGGKLIEFDFKQLEVCVFAFLTKDVQLLSDLRNGTDIHTALAMDLLKITAEEVTKEIRQMIKPCTFHVIYGGGPNRLAKEHNLEVDFCKQFIETFYSRYPMAKIWQDSVVRQVEGTKKITDKMTPLGMRVHEGIYRSVTGRKYVFYTTDSPTFLREKGILTGFNPPDLKNYPVQGLATADIVLMQLGKLFRMSMKHRDKFLIINTVHDSVLIDCMKNEVNFTCNFVKNVLLSIKESMKSYYNIEWEIPIDVDIKIGDSWWDC